RAKSPAAGDVLEMHAALGIILGEAAQEAENVGALGQLLREHGLAHRLVGREQDRLDQAQREGALAEQVALGLGRDDGLALFDLFDLFAVLRVVALGLALGRVARLGGGLARRLV